MLRALRLAATVFLALALSPAMAAQKGGSKGGGFDPDNLFFGVGVSQNDVSGSDKGTGYQFFGGYEFGEVAKNLKLDVEVGYMTTGDMDVTVSVPLLGTVTATTKAKGLWSTAVARLVVNPQWELVGRAGLDFGDDDGFMFGVGAGYIFSKQSTLRFELVERDNVSSLQLNYVYRP